jgi:hypothetical protein
MPNFSDVGGEKMELSDKTKKDLIAYILRKECWLWWGEKDSQGNCWFYIPELQMRVRPHKFLYELKYGDIPAGLVLYQLCGRRNCVRPSHQRLVTHREKCRLSAAVGSFRGERNGRTNKKKEDIVAIRLLHEDLNVPIKTIAGETGISQRTINSYKNRETWSHVKLPPNESQRDGFLMDYLNEDLPTVDSPFSCNIRSLIKQHYTNIR